MITRYTEYIKESLEDNQNNIFIILDKCIEELNLEYTNFSFWIKNRPSEDKYYIYYSYIKEICYIDYHTTNFKLKRYSSSNDYYDIDIQNKNIINILKEKIMICYILELYDRYVRSNIIEYLNMNMSLDDIINTCFNQEKFYKNNFIEKVLPELEDKIKNKYDYLINANNFDLI